MSKLRPSPDVVVSHDVTATDAPKENPHTPTSHWNDVGLLEEALDLLDKAEHEGLSRQDLEAAVALLRKAGRR